LNALDAQAVQELYGAHKELPLGQILVAGRPIENIRELAEVHRRLKALGYRTVEQFLGAAHASRAEMSRFLGTDVAGLVTSLPPELQPLADAAKAYAAAPRRFPLGAALDRIPRRRPAFGISMAAATLPSQVDLTGQMPSIKDQGKYRGTCVAFATLAAIELYATQQGTYQDLSEEFLYWDCKANDGFSDQDDTSIQVAFSCLQTDGCCLAATWQYNPAPIAGNVGQGPPPAGAQAEAANYKVPAGNALTPTSVQDLKSELARRRAVAFDIPVFDSWYRSNGVTLSGDIVMPFPGSNPPEGTRCA
jgi:hypothetical protein